MAFSLLRLFRPFATFLLIGAPPFNACLAQAPPKPEIRGFWADGFADGFKTPGQVDTLIRRLTTAHCNAIFAQMRKGGDAYYQSRYEPWAYDNKNHFDALNDLILKAHACRPRIQVHAWINTCAVGKSHGNAHHIAIAHPEYKSLSDIGEDYDNEATKIDPGNPEAADWTFRVYLDVARRYDVDGIHFDFVRYGSTDGKGRFGYNPVSVARYNARYGKTGQPEWTDPLWMQWRRDQVTALVRKVYAMSAIVKPKLTVSAATITWLDGPHDTKDLKALDFWQQKSAPMNKVFQDWRSWMSEGIIDLNCQMSYYAEAKHADWYRHWINWGKDNQYNRWVVPSSGIWLNSIQNSLQQIAAIRKPSKHNHSPAGVMLYCYAETNLDNRGETESYNDSFYSALSSSSPNSNVAPFESKVEFPTIPWKETPKTGHLKGFVLTADGLSAVDGIVVSLRGPKRREIRSDGTGFFAFIDLPEGEYVVRVEGNGYSRQESRVHITRGSVTTSNLLVGQASSPILDATQSNSARKAWDVLAQNSPVRIQNATVLIGTDTLPGRLLVKLDAGPALLVMLDIVSSLPIVSGDVVAIQGIVISDGYGRYLKASKVALTDMAIPDHLEANAMSAENLATLPSTSATIEGMITNRHAESFDIDTGVHVFHIQLQNRKGVGVEDPVINWSSPNSPKAHVVGIVVQTGKASSSEFDLYPFQPSSIQPMAMSASDKRNRAARWSAGIFCDSSSAYNIVGNKAIATIQTMR